MQGSTKSSVVLKKMGGAGKGTSKPNAPKFSVPVAKDSQKLKSKSGPAFTQKMATAKFHATKGGSSVKKKLGGRY